MGAVISRLKTRSDVSDHLIQRAAHAAGRGGCSSAGCNHIPLCSGLSVGQLCFHTKHCYCIIVCRFLRDDTAAYSGLIGWMDHGWDVSNVCVTLAVFLVLIINLPGIFLPVIFRFLIILLTKGHANEPLSDSPPLSFHLTVNSSWV